ncbi:MAG: hypothetical protein JO305_04575 [Alphaproteobacteria bacterium]|nr:hypothetical protein [Alphaproteobacteria bacterium]
MRRYVRVAVTRPKRLAIFALSSFDPLPTADLYFRQTCEREECAPIAAAITQCSKFYRTEGDWHPLGFLKKTASLIDLSSFPDIESYFAAVSKITKGKYLRSAKKARRSGYFTRRIGLCSHLQSHFDIKASKPRRSHGLMLEASGDLMRPEQDVFVPPVTPACHEHWRLDFGLFNRDDDRMWGFASLIRTGNFVQLDQMISHADVLPTGGMKLLQFDIMTWLLQRSDSLVAGLDYLFHGAIEDGSPGAAAWRRYVMQHPHVLRLINPEPSRLPAGFDAQAYLALNPDVRAAGVEPRKHYLRHGVIEGRQYKIEPHKIEPADTCPRHREISPVAISDELAPICGSHGLEP